MNIEFKRHRQSKHIRISIKSDGNVLVTFPFWSSKKVAIKFANEKMVWIENYLKEMKNNGRSSILSKGNRKDYLEKKEIARKMITKKIEQFNQHYGFKYNKIVIRNQKSRWGSCSSKNNLNFNYKVVYLPEKLVDYLVVHELCHLKQMNHSRKFWDLVGETVSNHCELSKKLRAL